MENDVDYPYLEIYPPFSFYMNPDNELEEQEEPAEEFVSKTRTVKENVKDKLNETRSSVYNSDINIHKVSTASGHYLLSNTYKGKVNGSYCVDIPADSSTQSLCDLEPKIDKLYTVDCESVSDCEYDTDSGVSSATTSPVASETGDGVCMSNSSVIISEKNTPVATESYNSGATCPTNNSYDGQHKIHAAQNPVIFLPNSKQAIPSPDLSISSTFSLVGSDSLSSCIKTTGNLAYNCSGIFHPCLRSSCADTITVSSYYPRMYNGSPSQSALVFTRSSLTVWVIFTSRWIGLLWQLVTSSSGSFYGILRPRRHSRVLTGICSS